MICSLNKATIKDYQIIQNMARFYVYDLSKSCGFNSYDWAMPNDGLYESFDFKEYLEPSSSREAYIVKVNHIEAHDPELGGFVLINKDTISTDNDWNMGEFFIISRFQRHGLGSIVATQIWEKYPGKWEISVIPENIQATNFWEKTIKIYTNRKFLYETKTIDYDEYQPKRIVFSFSTM